MSKRYSFPDSLYKRLKVMDNGCIEFVGARHGQGYGQLGVGGKTRKAHILAYELEVGPVPDGKELDHLCKNPPCVNVDHLEPVTHEENVRRGDVGLVNKSKTHCLQGHELDGDNLYITPDKRRNCRACKAEAQRRYKARGTVTRVTS